MQMVNNFFEQHTPLEEQRTAILSAAEAMLHCYRQGGKVLACGNGGSCADADHITAELLKGFLRKRPLDTLAVESIHTAAPDLLEQQVAERLQLGLPAISLCNHSAAISAIANDLGADLVYAQQLLALGRPGDLLLGISTSGNADNVYKAMAVAKAKSICGVLLTGNTGGRLASIANITIFAPSDSTPAVQEYHLAIYHFLCAYVEANLFEQ